MCNSVSWCCFNIKLSCRYKDSHYEYEAVVWLSYRYNGNHYTCRGCLHIETGPWCHGYMVRTLRPKQNWRHFADEIFKCIFLNENVLVSLKISLKFVPKVPLNNIPGLVRIMAWHRQAIIWTNDGYRLLTHICVTRPQWDTYGYSDDKSSIQAGAALQVGKLVQFSQSYICIGTGKV